MRFLFIILIFTSALSFNSCDKSDYCYDEKMEQEHSGICPDGGPRVCGCDGQTYINECYANRKGIKVISNNPCD